MGAGATLGTAAATAGGLVVGGSRLQSTGKMHTSEVSVFFKSLLETLSLP